MRLKINNNIFYNIVTYFVLVSMDVSIRIIDDTIENLRKNIRRLLILKENLTENCNYESNKDENEIEDNKRVFLFENGQATTPKVYTGSDIIDKLNRLDNVFDVSLDHDCDIQDSVNGEVKLVL